MGAPPSAGDAKTVALEQVSLPRLLFALLHQRFSGVLQVEQPSSGEGDPGSTRSVWFQGGMPLFTDWAAPEHVLGRVMVDGGLISDDQLMAALESMAEQGGLLGEILVSQNSVEQQTVLDGLRRQCTRKLIEIFALRSGQVTVLPSRQEHDEDLTKVNVLELILQGVSAHYDRDRVSAEMGPALRGQLAATAALQRYRAHFRFRDTDAPALDALQRGAATLDQLERTGISTRRAAQLVYALWACQMLRVGAAAGASTSSSVKPASRPLGTRAPTTPRPNTPMPSTATRPGAAGPSPTDAPPSPRPATSRPPSPAPVRTGPRKAAPAPAPSEPEGESSGFEADLAGIEKKIEEEAHAFDLLGVPLTADKKEIRRAFSDLSRKFHPDALQAKGLGHLRERVSKAFASLSEAQMLLGDKQKRQELREAIERGEDPRKTSGSDATAMARAAFESEIIAKEADKLLRANRFDRALERYEQAAALTPDEPDLGAAIAWCRYNLSSKDMNAATAADRALFEIVEASPKLARAHYFRGLVLRDLGRNEAAIEALTKAHRHDRRLIDAERHARALRMQAGRPATATTGPKPNAPGRFGLKGLFGKK